METKLYQVKYDADKISTFKYYLKRFFKHTLSFVIAASMSYMLNDVRFVALTPILEIVQKYLKEKGLWF